MDPLIAEYAARIRASWAKPPMGRRKENPIKKTNATTLLNGLRVLTRALYSVK
jgi:hypothetical protein